MDWFDSGMLSGIATYASKAGWSLLFDCAQIREWSVPDSLDGVICLVGPSSKREARIIKALGVPTVVLSEGDEGRMEPCTRVVLDDAATGRMAAEYFLSLGFKNFLLVGKRNRGFSRARLEAFQRRAAGGCESLTYAWVGDGLSAKALRNPIEKALRTAKRPLAVFASSDPVATHVSRFAIEMGLHIPEEVAILGAGNTPLLCENAPVPLSSVEINHEKLGYEGGRMLHLLLANKKQRVAQTPVGPSCVFARQSTNIVAVPDVGVAKALRFIWENTDRVLPVATVADFAGISLPTLESKFRVHLRSSVVSVIMRSRVDRAKILLTSSNDSAKEIANRCGFSSPNYFNNVFRKITGQTPKAYRRHAQKA